jgi:hypothetical protein
MFDEGMFVGGTGGKLWFRISFVTYKERKE